ncbi:hypothetical protein V6N13_109193 [Hibiscus sabdariffa]
MIIQLLSSSSKSIPTGKAARVDKVSSPKVHAGEDAYYEPILPVSVTEDKPKHRDLHEKVLPPSSPLVEIEPVGVVFKEGPHPKKNVYDINVENWLLVDDVILVVPACSWSMGSCLSVLWW